MAQVYAEFLISVNAQDMRSSLCVDERRTNNRLRGIDTGNRGIGKHGEK